MTPHIDISVVVCTRNRSYKLQQTLASIGCAIENCAHLVELLVVDNGSTDETRKIVSHAATTISAIKYEFVPEPGQVRARNRALEIARGKAIVFTDDDVLVSECWISKLATPILNGSADATQGAIRIAPELEREWMTADHRRLLMELTDEAAVQHEKSPFLIGANMAFGRHVLSKVPQFEVQLGPGALGFMDDTLFYLKLLDAGFSIRYVKNAAVIHYFDESRLLKRSQRLSAVAHARSTAWVMKNYWRSRPNRPLARFCLNKCRVWIRRLLTAGDRKGFDPAEIDYVFRASMYREFIGRA